MMKLPTPRQFPAPSADPRGVPWLCIALMVGCSALSACGTGDLTTNEVPDPIDSGFTWGTDASMDSTSLDASPVPATDTQEPWDRDSASDLPHDAGTTTDANIAHRDASPDSTPSSAWAGGGNRVRFINGQAQIEVDEKSYRPLFLGINAIGMTAQKWRDFEYQVALAKKSGPPIALVNMGWSTVTNSANRKDLFDRLARLGVKVMVRFSLSALTTKMMAHGTARYPLETALFENAAGHRVGMPQHQQCTRHDPPSCTNTKIIYRPSLDQGWLDNIWVEIKALLEDLNRSYPGRVIGLQLAYLSGGEWFLRWDDHVYRLPGNSTNPYFGWYEPGIKASFCTYLAREAPGLPCSVPSVAARQQGGYGALILDDSSDRARRSVHFNRFTSLRIVAAIKRLAAQTKALSQRRLLVSAFYGYLFEHNRSFSNLSASGHLAYAELLDDPNIDAITGPYSYGPSRSLGTAFEPHGPVDSPRLHGKLWIHEDDSRTHLASTDQHVSTLSGSRALVSRNGLTALLHQNGLYYFDLWTEGWFGQDRTAQTRADSTAVWNTIAGVGSKMAQLETRAPRAVQHQIAIFVDERTAARHPITTAAHRPYLESLYRDPVIHGSRLMAPVRYYLLSDLARPNFPAGNVRLAIFANAFDVSAAMRQTIRNKLHNSGKVLFYIHAAGAMRGGGKASTTHISDLLGFNVRRGSGSRTTASRFSDSSWTWLHGASFGLSAPIDPWFHVPAGQAGVYAVARDSSQQITVARKNFGTHRVLYAATPGAPRDLYRTAADWARVHPYSNNVDDVVEARGNLLMLHTGGAGKRTVKLPFAAPALYLDISNSVPLPTPRLLCTTCTQTEIKAPTTGATYLLRWK